MSQTRMKTQHVWDECKCAECGAVLPAHQDHGYRDVGDETIFFCERHTRPYSHLNVYMQDRAYGGCEEGGWWYDTYDPITSIECEDWCNADVDVLLNMLKRNYSNEGRRHPSSMASDGHYFITFEDGPATAKPERRPVYS